LMEHIRSNSMKTLCPSDPTNFIKFFGQVTVLTAFRPFHKRCF
jgi:hypothetical protein